MHRKKLALVISTFIDSFIFIFSVSIANALPNNAPLTPSSSKTQGDVLTQDTSVICQRNYTKTVRDVPEMLKTQVYQSYGIISHQPNEYEVDHLISLELGGSNSILNLWPQSYVTMPLNAHVKDKLEDRMHSLICKGELDIKQAQLEIAKDWISAYEKYIGAIPGGRPKILPPTVLQPKPEVSMDTGSQLPDASGRCPTSAPVKVSINGISHAPSDADYNRTIQAKYCFATLKMAIDSGYRAEKH